MSRTYQNVADRARQAHLNDAAKTRWSDADLIAFANDFVLRMRRQRPDLFIGQWAALPSSAEVTVGATALPLPDEYFVPAVHYVCAIAHGRDSEDAIKEAIPVHVGLAKEDM